MKQLYLYWIEHSYRTSVFFTHHFRNVILDAVILIETLEIRSTISKLATFINIMGNNLFKSLSQYVLIAQSIQFPFGL
ncbi:hypothetical protein D3C77_565980 [compost metagenome]